MAKTKIEIEVEVDEAGVVTALSIGQTAYTLPEDKPMPRKFAKDIADAAGRKLRAIAKGELAPS